MSILPALHSWIISPVIEVDASAVGVDALVGHGEVSVEGGRQVLRAVLDLFVSANIKLQNNIFF